MSCHFHLPILSQVEQEALEANEIRTLPLISNTYSKNFTFPVSISVPISAFLTCQHYVTINL